MIELMEDEKCINGKEHSPPFSRNFYFDEGHRMVYTRCTECGKKICRTYAQAVARMPWKTLKFEKEVK